MLKRLNKDYKIANVALDPSVTSLGLPTDLGPARRAEFEAAYRGVQADVDPNELNALQRTKVLELLARYDVEHLAEIVRACGRAEELRDELSKLPSASFLLTTMVGGRPQVKQSDLWRLSLQAIGQVLRDEPQTFVDAIDALKAEKVSVEFSPVDLDELITAATPIEAVETTDPLKLLGEGLRHALAPLSKQEQKTVLENLIAVPESALFDPPRRVLLEWGSYYLRTEDEFDVEGMMKEVAIALVRQTRLRQMRHLAKKPHLSDRLDSAGLTVVMTGASWAKEGFPMVQPTHKLAASLMATHMPRDLVPEVKLPWNSFAVLVPNGLLPETSQGTATMVGVSNYEVEELGMRRVVWIARDNALLEGVEIEKLEALVVEDDGDHGTRERMMLYRLLLGCIVELDQPKHREIIQEGPKTKSPGNKRASSTPSCWAFDLRRDTKVDLRPWVKSYLSGEKGRSPGVQILVRGHHKWQPFGKGRAERKWIHIEPYWRGPEDAPVAVRAHRIDKKEPDES